MVTLDPAWPECSLVPWVARRDRITTAHFCPNCGKPVPEASRFCTECGLALPEAPGAEPADGASAAATPPPPAPATTSATPAAPVSTAPSAPPPRTPAAPPVAPPAGQGSNRTLLVVGLVVVLLAAAGGIGWLVFGGDDDGGGDDEAGEVFLEPVNVTVADPFGGNFDVHNVRATATTAPRIATTAPPSTATATTTATATATRSVAGAWPGLYGGTRNASTCDRSSYGDSFKLRNYTGSQIVLKCFFAKCLDRTPSFNYCSFIVSVNAYYFI